MCLLVLQEDNILCCYYSNWLGAYGIFIIIMSKINDVDPYKRKSLFLIHNNLLKPITPSPPLVVDLLAEVGLRDGSLSEDGASLSPGPSGVMDSFSLTRPLSAATDSTRWQILGGDSQSSLSLFTVLEASGYSGSVISIGDQLDVSLSTVVR